MICENIFLTIGKWDVKIYIFTYEINTRTVR